MNGGAKFFADDCDPTVLAVLLDTEAGAKPGSYTSIRLEAKIEAKQAHPQSNKAPAAIKKDSHHTS